MKALADAVGQRAAGVVAARLVGLGQPFELLQGNGNALVPALFHVDTVRQRADVHRAVPVADHGVVSAGVVALFYSPIRANSIISSL